LIEMEIFMLTIVEIIEYNNIKPNK
jgi:hypothetical protein